MPCTKKPAAAWVEVATARTTQRYRAGSRVTTSVVMQARLL